MNPIFLVALLFYAAAAFFHILYFIREKEGAARTAYILTLAGFVAHLIATAIQWANTGHFPAVRWYESISFLAWAMVLVYLSLAHISKLKVLGVFIVPVASIALFTALLIPKKVVSVVELPFKTYWLLIHTSIIFLSYAAFISAFGLSIMYLIEEKMIKEKKQKKHVLMYRRLPPLEALDSLCYKCIAVGFPFLTVGIATGAIWASNAEGINWSWKEPKVVASLGIWCIYALLLGIRLVSGWRGRKMMYLAVAGFLAVLITYIGINLLLPGIHRTYAFL